MIRALVLAAAVALAAPAAAAPAKHAAARPAHDWLATVVATPEGGFRMGNPAAKVKLVEYGSFTCPHCAAFAKEATAELRRKYIATGKVSFEFRSFVRNGPDYGATLLAQCDGPGAFFARADSLFAAQDVWIKPFETLEPGTVKRLAALPPEQQIGAFAKAGGLDAFMVARGLPQAKADRCLADKAATDRLTEVVKHAVEAETINYTPGFLIDGKRQSEDFMGQDRPILTWARLEARLVAALGGGTTGLRGDAGDGMVGATKPKG